MSSTATKYVVAGGQHLLPYGFRTAAMTAAQIIAATHSNPENLDLFQVINEGGKVVWNLNYAGVASTNPSSPTMKAGKPVALLAQWFGTSLAAAHANLTNSDLYQVNNGSAVVLHVDYTGTVYVP